MSNFFQFGRHTLIRLRIRQGSGNFPAEDLFPRCTKANFGVFKEQSCKTIPSEFNLSYTIKQHNFEQFLTSNTNYSRKVTTLIKMQSVNKLSKGFFYSSAKNAFFLQWEVFLICTCSVRAHLQAN